MRPSISRRDFLKLAGMLPLSLGLPPSLRMYNPSQPAADGRKNVLVIVFDAFSAYNIPIYGYPRQTTPNLSRLAERAIVYHNHYAGSSFTTPGTASLLTGTLPWKHRAFKLGRTVTPSFADKSLFDAFQDSYRIVYSHNPLVNTLFDQFAAGLDDYVPWNRLMLTTDAFPQAAFARDQDIADVGWTRILNKESDGYSYSLLLSELYSELYRDYVDKKVARFRPFYPLGVPRLRVDNYFLLEDAITWLQHEIGRLPQPYLGYFHFLPPHFPSATHRDFYKRFAGDQLKPPAKPVDVFAGRQLSETELLRNRTDYDEFVLYVDREVGRLFDFLESSGALQNTWVVFSSDHGELFERGFRGHVTPMLYEPVVRVPLLIFEPGRTSRTDIHIPTSAVDVLPTLLHVAGRPPVDWTEGTLLPPFGEPDPQRSVYALYAKLNDQDAPLRHATAILVKGRYKVLYYFGYEELGAEQERVELYDLESDPEELHNLLSERQEVAAALLAALKQKLDEVNKPYV
jgi:choline-sulfatase